MIDTNKKEEDGDYYDHSRCITTEERRQVWANAWYAVATCINIRSPEAAASWADACLDAYEKKFGHKE